MEAPGTLPICDSRLDAGTARRALLIRIGQCHRAAHPAPRILDLDPIQVLHLGRGETDRLEPRGDELSWQVDDPWMSTHHAELRQFRARGHRWFVVQDAGSKNGCRVNGKRLPRHQLGHGDILETGQTFWKYHDLMHEGLDELLDRAFAGGEVLPTSSVSPLMLGELRALERVASTDIPIIVLGESGTGKEVLTTEIHRRSGRAGSFVALNCAAIPEGLLESELFGHRRGAFTGAVADKRGLVEMADGGTLMLDEVGDLPGGAQAKLLRLLQDGSFVRVGEASPRNTRARFIAATHRDLERMVADETFRGDLFARLNGFCVQLPALRQRKEDLGLLIPTLLRRHLGPGSDQPPRLSLDAYRALLSHDWPFNIRELDKALRSALTLAGPAPVIELGHLPRSLGEAPRAAKRTRLPGPPPDLDQHREMLSGHGATGLDDHRLRAALETLLAQHNGNISAVSRDTGRSRVQIHRWLKRLRLDPTRYREA